MSWSCCTGGESSPNNTPPRSDLIQRGSASLKPVHVINLDTKDNHVEAELGSKKTLKLFEIIDAKGEDWEDSIEDILEEFEEATGTKLLHSVQYY